MVGLGRELGDVVDYVRDNDLGTAALLAAVARHRRVGRLVLASSMVVYGEGAYRCGEHGLVRPGTRAAARLDAGRFDPPCPRCGADLEPVPVSEDTPPDPRSVYAATKLHQEQLAAACALAAGRAPEVFEDGAQRRDFVHVSDVARANLAALASPEPLAGAVNVASGHPHTVGELAAALAAVMGGPAPRVTGGWRPGDVRHVVASPALAAASLGFRARVGFAEGMAELARAELRAPVPAGPPAR
jgi:dTDP-L-rhamnose 4-epimerase